MFWNQQPIAAREYASSTIIPACTVVVDISNSAKDFIEKEVSAFYRSPDNSLYMLPATPQVCNCNSNYEGLLVSSNEVLLFLCGGLYTVTQT